MKTVTPSIETIEYKAVISWACLKVERHKPWALMVRWNCPGVKMGQWEVVEEGEERLVLFGWIQCECWWANWRMQNIICHIFKVWTVVYQKSKETMSLDCQPRVLKSVEIMIAN